MTGKRTLPTDKRPIKIRKIGHNHFEVSGCIPGHGQAHGLSSDQVRRRSDSATEAESIRAELQAVRDAARRGKFAVGNTRRWTNTALPDPVLAQAEAGWQLAQSKRDARPLLELIEAGLGVKKNTDRSLTLALPEFLEHKSRMLAHRSYVSLANRVQSFVTHCSGFPTEDDCRKWMQFELGTPQRAPAGWTAEPQARINRRADAMSFTRWCVNQGFLAIDPWTKIGRDEAFKEVRLLGEDYRDKTPGVLNAKQVVSLLKSARSRYNGTLFSYFALSIYAGLRPSEIARLEPNNIEARYIVVRGKNRRNRSERIRRRVPIEPLLAELLKGLDWKKQLRDVLRFRRRFLNIREHVGMHGTWSSDCLRHTYVSARRARGDQPEVVARDAGHHQTTADRHYDAKMRKEDAVKIFSKGLPARVARKKCPIDPITARVAIAYERREERRAQKRRKLTAISSS